MALRQGVPQVKYHDDFSGGINYYLGPRQIKDNESPEAVNCDFKGKSGIGSRDGFAEIGVVTETRTAGRGMGQLHTSSIHQLIKFASDGVDCALGYSTGGAWTFEEGTVFTHNKEMDIAQGGSVIYTGNGTDAMYHWDGAAWTLTTNGTKVFHPVYYNKALWGVDETIPYRLNTSGKYDDAASKLGDFTYADPANKHAQTNDIEPGSGLEIVGLIPFKNYLYIFTNRGIWRTYETSTANTYAFEKVTSSIGCVSHRSIVQVGEDVFFAADDGVYSLGEVANYTEIRTTNKSGRIQEIFDGLSAANKGKLCAVYHKFKYHLFYSSGGTNNDACIAYDTRYGAWVDWDNLDVNSATLYNDDTDDIRMFFLEPTTGEVNEMYSGATDDGTAIESWYKTKSFDEGVPDIIKHYKDTTFIFGALEGTATLSIIFNDNELSTTKTLSQLSPQGGYGRDVFGRMAFGDATNTETITQVYATPQRFKAKGKKFAIQYKIYCNGGSWQLDSIGQYFIPYGHQKFPSANKLS